MSEPYAFPRRLPNIELPPDEALACLQDHAGMTLRDYFAAAALAGLVGTEFAEIASEKDIADDSYRLADAMLEARK